MSKMGGGLKSGIKQQDMTRRLDDNLSSSDFDRSRKSTKLRKHVKSLSEQLVYIFIGVALFFCAIRFTIQTWFPHKIHSVLAPILGKNAAAVEQTLTGTPPAEQLEDPDAVSPEDQKAADEAAAKAKAEADKKKKQKRHGHSRRRHKH